MTHPHTAPGLDCEGCRWQADRDALIDRIATCTDVDELALFARDLADRKPIPGVEYPDPGIFDVLADRWVELRSGELEIEHAP